MSTLATGIWLPTAQATGCDLLLIVVPQTIDSWLHCFPEFTSPIKFALCAILAYPPILFGGKTRCCCSIRTSCVILCWPRWSTNLFSAMGAANSNLTRCIEDEFQRLVKQGRNYLVLEEVLALRLPPSSWAVDPSHLGVLFTVDRYIPQQHASNLFAT